MDIAVFAKSLQAWSIEECAQRVRSAGFEALDLTVRPGGYVEPGSGFAENFASAVRVIREAGLRVPLITTGLVSAADPAAAETMHLAAAHGIHELKLHYWPWDGATPFTNVIDVTNRELDGLARLAETAGVRINIHNHSGLFVNHSVGAIAKLLQDRDPRTVGAYLDPAHFTLEGGLVSWRSSLQTLASRATLLAIKDFRWIDVGGNASIPQERRWVPVGTGNVPLKEALAIVRKTGFNGPVSIHCEYQGRWSWRELDAEAALQQAVMDRQVFRNAWEAAGEK